MLDHEKQPDPMKIKVLAEIKEYAEKTGDDEKIALGNFLNNIHLNLPGGNGFSLRDEDEITMNMDSKELKEFYRSFNKYSEQHSRYLPPSSLKFRQDVLTAIKRAGINRDKLINIIDNIHREEIAYKTERDIFLPIYIELRKMGYLHHDITG